MNNFSNNSLVTPKPRISDLFRKLGDAKFFIYSDCVFTQHQILVINSVYQILDFLDNGDFRLSHIKLLDVNLKGFDVLIFGVDMLTGEATYRKLRLNNNSRPCDSLIIDLNYFEKDMNDIK